MSDFNEKYRLRTKKLALEVIWFCGTLGKTDGHKIISKQLLRSATSVEANFRAATRARSSREYYAKLCIVVEEADESLFWLELLEESKLAFSEDIQYLKEESLEIVKIMSRTRKTAKLNT